MDHYPGPPSSSDRPDPLRLWRPKSRTAKPSGSRSAPSSAAGRRSTFEEYIFHDVESVMNWSLRSDLIPSRADGAVRLRGSEA